MSSGIGPQSNSQRNSSGQGLHPVVDLVRAMSLFCLALRLVVACTTKTSFHPDEYYQSVEPSYHLVFGNATTTWEWAKEYRIRSLIPLLPMSAMYYVCKLLALESVPVVMALIPRLSQAVIAFAGDYYFIRLTKEIFNNKVDLFLILNFFQIFSWSNLYCLSRTLINGTETTIFIFIVHESVRIFGKFSSSETLDQSKSLASYNSSFSKVVYYFVCLTNVAIYIRPTLALILLPFFASYCYAVLNTSFFVNWWANNFKIKFILKVVSIAMMPIFVCICLDSYLFHIFDGLSNKSITDINVAFPLVSFIKFNYFYNVSSIFGIKPKIWNFKEGLPTMLGLYTPLLCIFLLKLSIRTIFLASPSESKLLSMPPLIRAALFSSIAFPILLSIFTSHFELRFLLVCLPGFHLLLGYYYYINFYVNTATLSGSRSDITKPALNNSKKKGLNPVVIALMFILNVCFASYMNLCHQSGPEDAIYFINSHLYPKYFPYSSKNRYKRNLSVYLLAPCYSFPGTGYFLPKTDVNFPKCPIEPKFSALNVPIRSRNKLKYIDESALFISSPVDYVKALMEEKKESCDEGSSTRKTNETINSCSKSSSNSSSSSNNYSLIAHIPNIDIILTFDGYLSPQMNETLALYGYSPRSTFHHAHLRYDYDDPIRKKQVILFTKNSV